MVNNDRPGSGGSLVAALTLLVLFVCSVAVNGLLWRWGDTQIQHAASAQTRLQSTQAELRLQVEQAQLMKSMLGMGSLTRGEIDALTKSGSADPEIEVIASCFARDMDLFAPDVAFQNRNYPALSTYLSHAIKNGQTVFEAARLTD